MTPPTVRELVKLAAVVPAANRYAFFRDALRGHMTDDDVTILAAVGVALTALWVYVSGGSSDAGVLTSIGDDLTNAGVSYFGGDVVPAPQPPAPPQSPDPVPPDSGGGVVTLPPTGGGSGDQIDLGEYEIVTGPPDVANWPIVTSLAITQLEPSIVPSFADPGWPNNIPPGFEGPIQYTVWAFVPALRKGGAFIEMWQGRGDCGNNDAGDVEHQLAQNWWYYASGMAGYLPSPGEQIGFMVSAGDSRMDKEGIRAGGNAYAPAERSNVVLVTMP